MVTNLPAPSAAEALEPCPFCGGNPRLSLMEHAVETASEFSDVPAQIECENCDAQVWDRSALLARVAWNRRASLRQQEAPAPAPAGEALEVWTECCGGTGLQGDGETPCRCELGEKTLRAQLSDATAEIERLHAPSEAPKAEPGGGRPRASDHADNCDWHLDQYDFECTCGAIRVSSASESVHEYAHEYEWRGDQDYTPSDFERDMIEDAINGWIALTHPASTPQPAPVADAGRVEADASFIAEVLKKDGCGGSVGSEHVYCDDPRIDPDIRNSQCFCREQGRLVAEALATRATLAQPTREAPDRVAELEAENARLTRMAADRRYMMEAYRSMLGPKGLEVARMWEEQGVQRQHTSWGPEAHNLTGEERAQILLDIEAAPKRRVIDIDKGIYEDEQSPALAKEEPAR